MPTRIILSLNIFTTYFLIGICWFVQIVHYPLLALVGKEAFIQYIVKQADLNLLLLAIPMFIEGFTALLLFWKPPKNSTGKLYKAAFLILIGVWVSTLIIQIPSKIISKGFHPDAHGFLVLMNWLKTIFWTARGAVLFIAVNAQLKLGVAKIAAITKSDEKIPAEKK